MVLCSFITSRPTRIKLSLLHSLNASLLGTPSQSQLAPHVSNAFPCFLYFALHSSNLIHLVSVSHFLSPVLQGVSPSGNSSSLFLNFSSIFSMKCIILFCLSLESLRYDFSLLSASVFFA